MSLWLELEQARRGDCRPLSEVLDAMPWNADGLVAAIAQRHDDGEVLMLAWMNRTALEETLASGRVCYWSRSRQRLWRKGETSGHRQRLVSAHLDCDGDALLLKVEQQGPACHTGRPNCFYNDLDGEQLRVAVSGPA
ncbi:phosphoribosyl-AMP cyclohydrolase [Ectopseudomonas toyotomiensis]|uniref:Phosphoribosyl-AMP cyclohydrolase n=1 Tax=Ectopseudomonas toyotomiensis TaxID=554344 RepID=A0ABD7DW63_9GAMM|nr:phosphoribosyl-AMP cyclohydrolase [Pseudomonas toyotomiensis]QSL92748.1 phosphoribosyl-AMP cyclohydrolase [Pseudomonas toyotomiensis]